MGGLFGGTMKAGKPQYTGIQIQTSTSTLPVPLIWGMNRSGPNLIWYGDFKANKKKQKAGKGGGQKQEYYVYSASLAMALCEGEIEGIGRVYIDQAEESETSFASTGYTLFVGSDPQSPWGYLTSKHPSEALNYPGVAYLAIANYDLGQTASLPQHNFEVKGLQYNSAETGTGDADSAIIIDEFLTDPQFGAGFPAASIDYNQLYSTGAAPTTGDSTFQTYCRSMGFAMSPVLSSQEPASGILDRWARLMNSAVVWTGEKLRFIPYGDAIQTGGGVKYLPQTEVRYTLTDGDYVSSSGSDPVIMRRSDPAEAYNSLRLEVRDRDNQYNDAPVDWKDQNLVETYGQRPEASFKATEITELDMASRIVSLMGQRKAYIRNEFEFTTASSYILCEPMDIIEIYDPAWGFLPVRIVEIVEQESGELAFLVEEFPEGVASTSGFGTQSNAGGGQNQATPPGPVNEPLIFEPPLSLTGGVAQIWAAVSGGDGTDYGPFWGGANVYLSLDDVTYQQVGIVESPARMGVLTADLDPYGGANPDTVHTLSVNLLQSNGELLSVSSVDAANAVTICYVDGEYVAYQDATLTGVANYDLDTLYRALYGSTAGAHLAGTKFARLDENIFRLDLQANYVGQTVYIKLQSFNLWGLATEDLADCVVYEFIPDGGGLPPAPTGFSAVGGYQQNSMSWESDAQGVSGYNVYAYHGTSTDFNDATFLRTTQVPSFIHVGLTDTDTWTYWVTSTTIGGESTPAGPETATTVTP